MICHDRRIPEPIAHHPVMGVALQPANFELTRTDFFLGTREGFRKLSKNGSSKTCFFLLRWMLYVC